MSLAAPLPDRARPVLVVGAGPVGQTVAALLARWRVPVLLFDQRSSRDPIGSKSICQARDVLDVWELVGVGKALATEGTTWTTARTFFRDQEIACWQFQDRGRSEFPAFVNIGQQRTEELLDRALDLLGVVPAWGHELVNISQTADDVAAIFRTDHGEITVRGSYLVLATGGRSDYLRGILGVSFMGETFDDQFLICDIKATLPGWETERRFYFDPDWNPGRQVLIHACPGSTYRIDWQVPAGYDLAEDLASGGLDRRIRRIIGATGYEIIWKSVYHFHTRHADHLLAGRVLLAGDVAHLVAPFGARGLNTGVFDAENAAWKIAFAANGWAGPGLLPSYDAERLAAARENSEVTAATMRFLAPQTEAAVRARREQLVKAAADREAAEHIDSGRFAEPFWYVASPLTTPDPDRPFEGRPPKGHTPRPAPGILAPDWPVAVPDRPTVTRLRELLRDGFAVLLGDNRHLTAVQAAVSDATDAPVAIISLSDLEGGSQVLTALEMRSDEAWLIRPDAYVAAIVPAADGKRLTHALRRALGY